MKQKYKIHTIETAVKVQNTKVVSVRKKDITKKACRVIKNGRIGIAGSIGDIDDNTLYEEAEKNLTINIPYNFDPEKPIKDSVIINKNFINHGNILENVEDILTFLREKYPEFDFSETMKVSDTKVTFDDSKGTKLEYIDSYSEMEFILKKKSSSNLIDSGIFFHGRNFNKNLFLKNTVKQLDAYKNNIELPEEDVLPVMMVEDSPIIGKLRRELNGERYSNGSSLFSGKIGEQLFNSKLNISHCSNPEISFTPFFDTEGVVNDNYEYPLIKDGVINNCFTNKKVATEYNLKHTGSASGDYDDVPKLGDICLETKIDSEDFNSKVKKGILVLIAAGGDFTPDGKYASPVQNAFLYENGEIVGSLPEFQVNSHLFKMYGDDYVGTFKSPFYFGDDDKITVYNMEIVK